jgi:hypothetical protein
MKTVRLTIFTLITALTVVTGGCKNDSKDNSEEAEKKYIIHTFSNLRVAFGGGFQQANEGIFNFPSDPAKVKKIAMFVKLRCPQEGCNAWDMFANIRVKNSQTNEWFELGRFITPYGVDNAKRPRGFEIDVTDFKTLLTGNVALKSFIEVWGADGWLLSVDFEVTEGEPDFKYYSIAKVLDYANHSLDGIPYGEDHQFVVEKDITIPSNAEKTSMRTIITGWGHATPADNDGRPCAEWCFRNHQVLINGVPMFVHELKGIGCGANPVQPQNGNWAPDRAGWCPGMEVPVRTDLFAESMAGANFSYQYQLAGWVNNMQSTASNVHAYYAISSFVVVKSNTPLSPAIVEDCE